ncbi:MAG: hypothetical protein KGR98_12490 [Verrucomicrobia bacterium]|nr:hypothetical protein [Verrucomicrobiota bacterium]MDE3098963.1 hypothetical protein [Verrucomicrobiota bacterium]
MALTTCPECGKSVSTTALKCPSCGFTRPTKSNEGLCSPDYPVWDWGATHEFEEREVTQCWNTIGNWLAVVILILIVGFIAYLSGCGAEGQ